MCVYVYIYIYLITHILINRILKIALDENRRFDQLNYIKIIKKIIGIHILIQLKFIYYLIKVYLYKI